MPGANEWSKVIASWITQDRAQGETIYMSVDEDTIDTMARERWGITAGFEDFRQALRDQLSIPATDGWYDAQSLRLPGHNLLEGRVPECTAFLALLVVCASHRGERVPDYEGGDTAEFFFPWVRKMLGGRPRASRSGLGQFGNGAPENDLWWCWGKYLKELGFAPVPPTSYQGAKINWGYALDQAILTASCRRILRGLDIYARNDFLNQIRRKSADRLATLAVPGATKHLQQLLQDRWGDPQVREEVINTFEGAPAGPRPNLGHVKVVRIRAGVYELRVEPPSRWNGCTIEIDGQIQGRTITLDPDLLRPMYVVFTLGKVRQEVLWNPEPFYRFIEPPTHLLSWSTGVPEVYEEHALLVKRAHLDSLKEGREAGLCKWSSEFPWGDWVDLTDFTLAVPGLKFWGGVLTVHSSGGVVFVDGVRTGEHGAAIRLLSGYLGAIQASDTPGQVLLDGLVLHEQLTPHHRLPLPELSEGEHFLEFQNRRTNLEVVNWKRIVTSAKRPIPSWLGKVK